MISLCRLTLLSITTAIKNQTSAFEITGVYPNPFVNYTGIQYYLYEAAAVQVSVYNLIGEKVFEKEIGFKNRGFYFEKFDLSALPIGEYILTLHTGYETISRKLFKPM
jgi:hypothetical protein